MTAADLGNDVDVTPKQIRARRERLGLSQRELGERAGRGLSTIQDFEHGRKVSAKTRVLIAAAIESLEAEAARPPEPMIEVRVSELQAVLDEIRALRRLHEETRARVEALASRPEDRP